MNMSAPRQTQIGFSLIELMITLAILAIITGIAYPMYRDSVIRANRSEAMTALLTVASNQEAHYLQNNTYTSTLTDVGIAADGDTENGYYDITIPTANATAFTATATKQNGQDDDTECASFSITQDGIRTALHTDTTDNTDECWR